MERKIDLKDFRIYAALLLLLAVMALLYPQVGKFPYEYQKGRPWMYETLITTFDFPILKTDDEFYAERTEAASDVVRYYTLDASQTALRLAAFSGSRPVSDTSHLSAAVTSVVMESLGHIYSSGLVAKFEDRDMDDRVIMVQDGKKANLVAASDVYDLAGADEYITSRIAEVVPADSLDAIVSKTNIRQYLVPNLTFDQKTTELLHRDAVNYISQTKGMMYTGQMVVAQGQTITEDVAQIIDSYKAEYEANYGYSGSFALLRVGQVVLLAVILSLLFLAILCSEPQIFGSFRKYGFVLLVFLLAYLATAIMARSRPDWLLIVPYTTFALFLLAFFRRQTAFSIYAVTLLPLLLMPDNGLQLFLLNLSAGAVSIISFKYFNRRWQQFVNALFIMVTLFVVYTAYAFILNGSFPTWKGGYLLLAVHAILVPAFYTLIFLFEKIFGLVSTARLRDLSDTGNPLLIELSRKAPGSFQHSLNVATLSESAARVIGADDVLTRAGALYHDVGKIKNPSCFVENQTPGVIYHDGLSPLQSAHDIIAHVDDGVELAHKYGLPPMVYDFITTHHGTGKTFYFYNKFCNEGGDASLVAPFTYRGHLPQTREQVVVMLADSIEAASRTLSQYTSETIDPLVEKIVSQKNEEMQLQQADITLSEIEMVKECFKTELRQMYHARIVYPERKK